MSSDSFDGSSIHYFFEVPISTHQLLNPILEKINRKNLTIIFHQIDDVKNSAEEISFLALEKSFSDLRKNHDKGSMNSLCNLAPYRVVAEVIYSVESNVKDQSDHFDDCVGVINKYIEAMSLLSGKPGSLLSNLSVQAIIPTVRKSNNGQHMCLFFMNDRLSHTREKDTDYRALDFALQLQDLDILASFSTLRRESWLAKEAGNKLMQIIATAACIEALLREISLLMMWNDNYDPMAAHIAGLNKDGGYKGIVSYVQKVLYPRFGENFNKHNRKSIIYRWKTNIADVRNDVIHQGRQPSVQEANLAATVLYDVEEAIGDAIFETDSDLQHSFVSLIFPGIDGMIRRFHAKNSDILRIPQVDHEWLQEQLMLYATWKKNTQRFRR